MAVDDSYTKALLHMDGSDASTTFTDESGKTWTRSGNAQIDTAQYVFGGASGLFDGTGDYISTPDSDDWQLDGGSDSNYWTIDFWVRFNGDPTQNGIITQQQNNTNWWSLGIDASTNLRFIVYISGVLIVISNTWNPSADIWYHVACVKNGTSGYMMFVDGTQIGSTQIDTDVIPDLTGALEIGRYTNSAGTTTYFSGWLDEVRISKGIARWTSNFTPPTAPYGIGHQVIWSS